MQKAQLIVLDGTDNSGKATQTKLLIEHLQRENIKVGTLDFPQYETNTFGQLIKECLQGGHGDFLALNPKIASTLYAADRYESKGLLQSLLAQNEVVILDRYVSANMLHQGAKIEDVIQRQQFLSWLDHVEYGVFGMPKPDRTVALDVSLEDNETILTKMVEDGSKTPDIAEKDREHQRRVGQCLTWLASTQESWTVVHCSGSNGLRSRESIHEEIYGIVQEELN